MEIDVKEHVDKLIDLVKTTNFVNKVTILTGDNGSGKSFIRKIMPGRIEEELTALGEKVEDPRHLVASVSMERRTYIDPVWAGLNCFSHDTPEDPTSVCTYRFIEGLLSQESRYIIIDEPEIGMSEETQLLLCNYLNGELPSVKDLKGVLVITHSRVIVNYLTHNQFINLEGLDEGQWLGRSLALPNYTFNDLEDKSFKIYREIEARIKDKKGKGKKK
jgi:hypothetical protein